jgi:hypothetical protein
VPTLGDLSVATYSPGRGWWSERMAWARSQPREYQEPDPGPVTHWMPLPKSPVAPPLRMGIQIYGEGGELVVDTRNYPGPWPGDEAQEEA